MALESKVKVRIRAKFRNRYNKAPHLTRDSYLTSAIEFVTRSPPSFYDSICTMDASGMLITTIVSDHWYDLGVKGQDHVYFTSTIRLVKRSHHLILM